MKERIKKFGLKIWDKIEDHLAAFIAIAIITIISILCHIFWKWLNTKHSLETYGWAWVLIVLVLVSLPLLIFWLLTRRRILYHEDEDIRNVLEGRLLREVETAKYAVKVDYCTWDKKLKLQEGSTKRLLKEVVEAYAGWMIEREGNNTMLITRVPDNL